MSEVIRDTIKREIGDISDYEHYYSHTCWCGNCGERNHCYVLRGRKLTGLEIECNKCGCPIRLRPSLESYTER